MSTKTEQPKPPARHEGTGQAAAAQKNREREARKRVIGECERLGFPREDWPAFVQTDLGPEYSHSFIPEPFQPPEFDRLQESWPDWVKRFDVALGQYREKQIHLPEFWVREGVDEPIPEARRSRGPGKKGRNSATDARYEWAARRLMGVAWKEIAYLAGLPEYRVRKPATRVLSLAGWDQQPTEDDSEK
jgi:hypothetical protein